MPPRRTRPKTQQSLGASAERSITQKLWTRSGPSHATIAREPSTHVKKPDPVPEQWRQPPPGRHARHGANGAQETKHMPIRPGSPGVLRQDEGGCPKALQRACPLNAPGPVPRRPRRHQELRRAQRREGRFAGVATSDQAEATPTKGCNCECQWWIWRWILDNVSNINNHYRWWLASILVGGRLVFWE